MASFGELANVAQLTGVDAVRLIGMIVKAAGTAKMHKKNCRQFALHLKLIGNLLEQLKISELKRYRETSEPLEHLEDALRRSYMLVQSCQDKSFLYMLAMGWNIVYQFRKAQNEIDQYLRLVPLITLVDNARVRERLEVIHMDHREYTLDDEDQKVQHVILDPEASVRDSAVLKKTLSCSYPNLPFKDALKKESQKLQLELHQSQANLDVQQCQVIQHLLEVTEAISESSLPEEGSPEKNSQKLERTYSATSDEHTTDHYYSNDKPDKTSRDISSVSSGRDLLSSRGSNLNEEWHADLLGCCSEPSLCLRTLFCPCSTLSKISTVATGKHISCHNNTKVFSKCDEHWWCWITQNFLCLSATGDACNDLMAYSLVLSCCCYTCCIRRKLRKTLNIKGGCIDDLLSHVMCCCCSLVQEWREIKIRGMEGSIMTRTSPPEQQYMES